MLHDSEMINSVKAINAEVTSLAGVLNSPDITGYATVKTSNQSVPVDFLAKKDGRTYYVFAVAMRNGSTTATFEVKSGKMVEVLGENRTIRIKKGRFNDEFKSYGVHLYKIIK